MVTTVIPIQKSNNSISQYEFKAWCVKMFMKQQKKNSQTCSRVMIKISAGNLKRNRNMH